MNPENRPYYQVEGVSSPLTEWGDGDPHWTHRVSIRHFNRHGQLRKVCISVIVYDNGEIGIDPTGSHGWPNTDQGEGVSSWIFHSGGLIQGNQYGVPRAVLMEFFLLVFENSWKPNFTYEGEKYYVGPERAEPF